jgi:hypothetical protein
MRKSSGQLFESRAVPRNKKTDRNHNLCELFFSKSPAIRVTYQNTVLDIVIGKINNQKRIFGARNEA